MPELTEPVVQSPGDPADRAVRRRVGVAFAAVVLVLAAVVVVGIRLEHSPAVAVQPLPVSAADQPGAGTPACATVMSALPAELGGQARRTLLDDLPGVRAWGDPATVLRCGMPSPEELTCSALLVQLNGVGWLQLSDVGQTTYLAADRSVRIALTVPDGSGTAGLQQVSDVISAHLPARPVCENGKLLPTDGGS